MGYAANASVDGITIQDLHIKLEGTLDLRTFLGLADGNAGFEGITVGWRSTPTPPRSNSPASMNGSSARRRSATR